MKTPDEIKKSLECCMVDVKKSACTDCGHCHYYFVSAHCDTIMHREALEYIRQLEAERDAAVADLEYIAFLAEGNACDICDQTDCENGCALSDENIGFKWRGVQKEE